MVPPSINRLMVLFNSCLEFGGDTWLGSYISGGGTEARLIWHL